MPFGGLLTAGLVAGGGAKYFLEDKPRANAERRAAAETIRYSPWTGMSPQPISNPSLLGNLSQGALTGVAAGQMAGGAEGGSFWDKLFKSKAGGGGGMGGMSSPNMLS